MSRVTAIISALVICIIVACHGLLIITVITPLAYKAQRDKGARELKYERGNTDMQMRQRDVAGARCKIHEGVS